MNKYDDMPLDEIIKLYAAIISDFLLDSERSQLHQALCKKLGVNHMLFHPMDDFFPGAYIDPRVAEAHLRKAIKDLKQ